MLFYVNLKILYLLFSFEVKNVYNINTQLNFLIAILFFTRKLKFYGQLIYLSNPTKKKKTNFINLSKYTLIKYSRSASTFPTPASENILSDFKRSDGSQETR